MKKCKVEFKKPEMLDIIASLYDRAIFLLANFIFFGFYVIV